jgi:hypothetical protein
MSYYEKLTKIMTDIYMKDYTGNDKEAARAVLEPLISTIYNEYGNDPGTSSILYHEVTAALNELNAL